jgi:SAM-dependent methyltransferase
MPVSEANRPAICDYEGSEYRTDFWEGKGRDYEDRVERIALRRLLPPRGRRVLEVGAGFGRLTNLFDGYEQVVLLDYSHSQLEYAREHFGDAGYLYVAADIYRMPFAPGVFDVTTLVRVLHHMADPPAALRAIRYAMQQGGIFVLEFANKQNLKAIARWLLRRQAWSPFAYTPVEFAELHFDFHPRYVRNTLRAVGFAPGRTLTVSHFRLDLLKRTLPTGWLAWLDSGVQWTGGLWQLSPSALIRSQATGEDEPAPVGAFWRCPDCGGFDVQRATDHLACRGCGQRWMIRNGVYDFKTPGKA